VTIVEKERANRLRDGDREFTYLEKHFKYVKDKIYDVAGISLADHKKNLVYNRLVRRIRALKMASFDQYLHYLDSSNDELSHFINAMTTNLTSFYRESHHFDYLTNDYLPQLIGKKSTSLRIWSSACSIGEEPYSIAMAVAEAGIMQRNLDVKIFATDIDTNVLQQAKSGIYNIDRIDNLSLARKRLALLKGTGAQHDQVLVKPELRSLVQFQQCNLMEKWPIREPLDIIFCRNVMIYYDKKTQNRLLDRMTEILKPGGLLCLGHSETPARSMSDYQALGRTMYQKL